VKSIIIPLVKNYNEIKEISGMPNIKPRVRTVVKCPYCQYEHELAEVIDPENLTGCAKPSNVIRDPTNTNIIYEE
jgi:hypothetical protein